MNARAVIRLPATVPRLRICGDDIGMGDGWPEMDDALLNPESVGAGGARDVNQRARVADAEAELDQQVGPAGNQEGVGRQSGGAVQRLVE